MKTKENPEKPNFFLFFPGIPGISLVFQKKSMNT